MEEIWKPVENYLGLYEVSNMGNVRSLGRMKWNGKGYHKIPEKILKPTNNGRGYLFVWLCKEGKRKMYKIHRLVAEAFLPNPSNLPILNHKNEIKTDNRAENLEWCSYSYNNNYGDRNKRVAEKLSRAIIATNKVTKQTTEFPSIREASRQLGISAGGICDCLKGKNKSIRGCTWHYVNDDKEANNDQK